MNKPLKWLLGLVGLAVVLIVAVIVIVPMVVDPNDYKDEIIAQVKETTGRNLSISDPLELSVFPTIAVRLGGVSLSNAPGFGDGAFAKVAELDLKVAFMPILSRSLEVDTVVLRGLELNLAKSERGETNWADLGGAETQAPAAAEPAGGKAMSVQIEGVIIENARLVWDDRQSGTRYEVSNLNVETGAIGSGNEVPVKMSVKLTSTVPAQEFEISLHAQVTADGEMTRVDVAGLETTVKASGEGLPSGGIELGITGRINYDAKAGTVAINDLAVSGPGVQLSGALSGQGLGGKPSFKGNLKLSESNLKQLMALGGTAPETTDPKAMTRVSAEFGIAASDSAASLKPFTMKIDDSTFAGDFDVTAFDGPAVKFALNLDAIDLDRYLPPESAEQTEAVPMAEDPLAALRTLVLDGSIKIGSVKVANLTTTDINVGIKSRAGVLTVNPMTAKLYQGTSNGGVTVDAREKTPRIKVKNALSGIQIGPLLQDMTDKDTLSGQGLVEIDVSMRGLDAAAIKKTLNGNTRFEFQDGAYNGLDVAGTICSVSDKLGKLLGGGTGELGTAGETRFSAMGGSASIANGVVTSDHLDIKSPLIRVTGAGEVNLPEDTVDYLVKAELVKACEGQGGTEANQLIGVSLPIRATGSLGDPTFSPDWASLGKELAKSKLKDKAGGLLSGKLPFVGGDAADGAAGGTEELGNALKKGLKSLF